MNLRKHMLLVVGGSIELVLLIAVVVLLVRFNGGYQRISRDLKNARARLEQLNHRNPFPSAENVQVIQQNRHALQAFLTRLQTEMRAKQVEAEKIEPAEFTPMIERTLRKVYARSRESGTKLPARFAYAVDQYAAGQLPTLEQLPRLVIQMKTIEAVCNLLLDARVTEILDIRRDVFERKASEETPSEGGAVMRRSDAEGEAPVVVSAVPRPAASELYSVERIEASFLARENNYWEALNALARGQPFMVVSDLTIEHQPLPPGAVNPQLPRPTAATPGAAPATPVYLAHEDRVVGGREIVKVSVTLDVYRFGEPAGEEATP